jgi:hypothetical protein
LVEEWFRRPVSFADSNALVGERALDRHIGVQNCRAASGSVLVVEGRPADAVRWVGSVERLRACSNVVFVAAFDGWNDAGEAATSAAQRLVECWGTEPLATIDLEVFLDFSSTRPAVELRNGVRHIVWPATTLSLGQLPDGQPVMLATGPEPQLRWRTYTEVILSVLRETSIRVAVLLGSLLADVPHTRPVRITRAAATPEVSEKYEATLSRYEGPTGMVGVLGDAIVADGTDAISVWAAVPHYLPGTHSPRATLALLEHVGSFLGHPIAPIDLHVEAAAFDRQLSEVIESDEDMGRYVQQLEEQFDSGDDDDLDEASDDADDADDTNDEYPRAPEDVVINGSLTDDSGRPLSGDELAAELEQFLRDQGS